MPSGQGTPSPIVRRTTEAGSAAIGIARNTGIAAVQRRVTTLELGVQPGDPEGFEAEFSKRWAGSTERKKCGAYIVQITRQCDLLGTESSPRPTWVCFQYQYPYSAKREHACGHEPIRARTDYDDVRIHSAPSARYFAFSRSSS